MEISIVSTAVFAFFRGFAEPQGHVLILEQKQGQVQVPYQLISFNEMQRPLGLRTSLWIRKLASYNSIPSHENAPPES